MNTHSFTLFASPKAFEGIYETIQYNAIKSWTLLQPRPEIILCGNDEGIANCAEELDLIHIPDIRLSELGTPKLDDVFKQVYQNASNEILVFINSDIILMEDFVCALQETQDNFNQFLMVGQRHNLEVKELIDFSREDWVQEIKNDMYEFGEIHPVCGIDYFAFIKHLWENIPSFTIGRPGYDNWLVWDALERGVDVVDVTDMVTVIHQRHDYNFVAGGKKIIRTGTEAQENFGLAESKYCFIDDANWVYINKTYISRSPKKEAAQAADFLKQWIQMLLSGNTGISEHLSLLGIEKVAIVGTKDTARTLLKDLLNNSIVVKAFFDSHEAKELPFIENIPVVNITDFNQHINDMDAVIITVDGDHDYKVKDQIRILTQGRNIYVLTWKDLVRMSDNFRFIQSQKEELKDEISSTISVL
ncbi:nucleoside-diphosphate sugar epimerase/dehydratase [Candidatus Omnitrophota bacterium]